MNNNPSVTICVLTYGNYPVLAQRCINSIIAMCPREKYKLIVGANAVCEETLYYLNTLKDRGAIEELLVSEVNLNKCPMMKRMFAKVQTEYIWWFDDDSYINHPDALQHRIDIAQKEDASVMLWGHMYFFGHENDFSYGTDVRKFVKNAYWYKGLEPPSWEKGGKGETDFENRGVGDGRWFFITGGCWFIRRSAIEVLKWPDSKLIKRNDDVFLCEAIRQQGWSFADIGPWGVAINTEARRGEGEDKATMEKQMEEGKEVLDLSGWFFDSEKKAYQEMVSSVSDGKIVEVGVWKGLSLSCILDICRVNKNSLYAVDPWLPMKEDAAYAESLSNDIYRIFTTNLKLLGHEETVKVIRKTSLEAAKQFPDRSLDLVFIDADHSYEAVHADIEAWWPKLRKGGILCGHDFTFKEGVARAVTRFFNGKFELPGGSVWKVVKEEDLLTGIVLSASPKGKGCLFIPTFRDTALLEENFASRPEITSVIDVIVVDDNFETEESLKVKRICRDNRWKYLYSKRERHGEWTDHYHDISGFNKFIWSFFVTLGKRYDYVIKMDTDAYVIEPDFFHEMDHLLYDKRAGAGTFEYRSLNDVKSFWELQGVEKYSFSPPDYIPHLQGGIYGLSKSALEEIGAMGFLEGIHYGFAEDGYMSYVCMLLGIPLYPVSTTGSWYHPYLPDLKSLTGLKAIHPMNKKKWEEQMLSLKS